MRDALFICFEGFDGMDKLLNRLLVQKPIQCKKSALPQLVGAIGEHGLRRWLREMPLEFVGFHSRRTIPQRRVGTAHQFLPRVLSNGGQCPPYGIPTAF
jgi:hypothetical protein